MAKTNQRRYPSDETENCAAQLSSLLVLLYGNGRESFNALFEHDRDNILWLASELATKIDKDINGDRGGNHE